MPANSTSKEQRKLIVLDHIVHEYVSSAVPISSMTVSTRMGGRVSSATVRNIMAELEDEGYIEQPHTSAGRVPTNKGYRQYVDMIRDRIRFEKREARRLAAEYDRRIRTIREVIRTTSHIISHELHNAGVVMWPGIEYSYLKHLELVKVRAETVLAVLVTMTNDVKNCIVKLERELKKTELDSIANYINSNYERRNILSIYDDLKQVMGRDNGDMSADMIKAAGDALNIIDAVIENDIENEIYWEGLDYFMDEPESRDINVTRNILRAFSEGGELLRVMKGDLPYEGIRIHIGDENVSSMLKDCAIITSGYSLGGRMVGRMGVIGPTRMDYDHAFRTLICLSDLISLKLEEING